MVIDCTFATNCNILRSCDIRVLGLTNRHTKVKLLFIILLLSQLMSAPWANETV